MPGYLLKYFYTILYHAISLVFATPIRDTITSSLQNFRSPFSFGTSTDWLACEEVSKIFCHACRCRWIQSHSRRQIFCHLHSYQAIWHHGTWRIQFSCLARTSTICNRSSALDCVTNFNLINCQLVNWQATSGKRQWKIVSGTVYTRHTTQEIAPVA